MPHATFIKSRTSGTDIRKILQNCNSNIVLAGLEKVRFTKWNGDLACLGLNVGVVRKSQNQQILFAMIGFDTVENGLSKEPTRKQRVYVKLFDPKVENVHW